MSEPIKPANTPKKYPASADDLKALRAQVTPKEIAAYPLTQKQVEAYQALGPLLDEIIASQK